MTGHIRARGKGAWGLKFDVRSDTGERKTRYATVHAGKREAQRKLTELLDKANKGTLLEPSKETLADYLERWLRDWAAINVSPKTGERYGQLLRSYVSRHVGAVRLQKLGGAHLGEAIRPSYDALTRVASRPRRGPSAMFIAYCIRRLPSQANGD
jgi:integrase